MGSINELWIPVLTCAHLLGVFLFFYAKEQLYGTVTNFRRDWARRLGLARKHKLGGDKAVELNGFSHYEEVRRLCCPWGLAWAAGAAERQWGSQGPVAGACAQVAGSTLQAADGSWAWPPPLSGLAAGAWPGALLVGHRPSAARRGAQSY